MARARDHLEITPEVLLRAYSIGLFPMAENAQDPTLFWVDPEERGVFPLDGLVISRSLAKAVRSDRFEIRVDYDYEAVIEGCATTGKGREGTWINARIRSLYRALFDLGCVHTIEAWTADGLMGGLYGVAIGAAFFGESMFHRQRDASKVSLVHLVARLRAGAFRLLDTQFVTEHLASLGAITIPRTDYHERLGNAIEHKGNFWAIGKDEYLAGSRALELLATRPRKLEAPADGSRL